MDVRELGEKLKTAGVVGAGGAGFPSYAKLGEGVDTIILNCAECEPLLKPHRQLLAAHACEILKGLDELRQSIGAARAIVALKPSYTEAAEAVETLLDAFDGIEIAFLPEIYPAGDEVVLIYETTGRVVAPGKIPLSVGVCVFNVETVYNAYHAINGVPVTHKFVTIAGEVHRPCTLRLPLGISFSDAVALAGGTTREDVVFISGGPMTGRIVSSQECVTKTTNAILVMPQQHTIVKKRRIQSSVSIKRAMSACCQCRMCTDLCPRHLLGHPIEPHKFMRAAKDGNPADTAALNTAFCSGCGVCEMFACPQGLNPRSLIGACKDALKREGVRPLEAAGVGVLEKRDYARLPMKRLTARLDLVRYDVPAPLTEVEIVVKNVKLPLRQHIGAPASAIVGEGDTVQAGQVVASVGEEKLGANLHTPIGGMVIIVTDAYMVIEAKRGNGGGHGCIKQLQW